MDAMRTTRELGDAWRRSTIHSMLFGRDAERSQIAALLDDARSGRSGVLVIRGEAGVGKSALLEHTGLRASGMKVLTGCGIESEAQLPYAGLHQILRPVLDRLERLAAPQRRALRAALGLEDGVGDEWFLVSLAVLSLLSDAAEDRPLLCLVDDAHWLDDASAESLVFAARRLQEEGVAMVFAARDGETRRFDAPGLPEIRLSGLDLDSAGALLDRHADVALSPAARERLVDGTGGNPLALLELSSALSEPELAGVEPMLQPLPVGARIERAFASQIERLSKPTQSLLLVAAADDSGGAATVLAASARLGADFAALDAAEQAGLVRLKGARLEFRHPLIRSVVYHTAPSSRRRAAHEALADVLEGEAGADRRAWHRAAASLAPDAAVAAELEQAARRAHRRSGFIPASLAFERASALTPDERHRVRLLMGAVEGAWFGGRSERALMLLEQARSVAADAIERAEIDRRRGLIEISTGVPADACEILIRGATAMGEVEADTALYMLSLACLAAAYGGDGGAVPAIAELATGLPSTDGPLARFLASFLAGTGAFFAEAYDDASASLGAAIEQADEADAQGSPQFLGLLLLAGGAGLFLGDDRAADRLNRRLVNRARDNGALTLLTEALPRLALTQVAGGEWSLAAAGLTEGVQLARQTGQHQVVAHMLAVLALVAGLRGDDDACRSLVAESTELAAARRLVHVSQTARWALLVLDLGHGRPDEAHLRAREISELPIALWAAPDRIEAAIRAGDAEAAHAWLARLDAWARSSEAPWACSAALRCHAQLADDPVEAGRLFASAMASPGVSARPYERARTELAFGEHLRRSRRRVEAREHLRAALEGFERLGAALWVERAREELRASGQTARRREPSTREDLTQQELQIARLVAQGLSNREVAAQLFLSPRTIDFHLRNVFRKLGLTSRMQLVQLDFTGPEADAARDAAQAIAPAGR
jgi:DNA-binding CsgD family transcriptional regulator